MSPEQKQFLSLSVPPARLTAEQTAWYLGFGVHEITTLVAAGLLHPLGRPCQNSPKYFATAELDELKADRKWLAKATDAIRLYWHTKNSRRPNRQRSLGISVTERSA